ncbi:MAG: 30S ribosomal protein S3 [Candidatus Woesearchaeota archaeon]
MIERTFVKQKVLEFQIKQDIYNQLRKLGVGSVDIQKTPLFEKILIKGVNPGKLVGKGGSNIRVLTELLKTKYKLENPQIEVKEEENPWLNARIVAEKIAREIEMLGVAKFKSIVHKNMKEVLNNGAIGVYIRLCGRVPSERGVRWTFQEGYLKKCGHPAKVLVSSHTTFALVKVGTIGVTVKIMPKDVVLPDRIEILDVPKEMLEEFKKIRESQKQLTNQEEEQKEEKKKRGRKPNQEKKAKESKSKTRKKKDEVKE